MLKKVVSVHPVSDHEGPARWGGWEGSPRRGRGGKRAGWAEAVERSSRTSSGDPPRGHRDSAQGDVGPPTQSVDKSQELRER